MELASVTHKYVIAVVLLVIIQSLFQAIDASNLDSNLKAKIKDSLATHAVAMIVRLKSVTSGDEVTVANIHVAYDGLERPDRRCIQVTLNRIYIHYVQHCVCYVLIA